MSSKRTPWSRSRHRAGSSADQFGSLDPRVIRAATSRPGDRPTAGAPRAAEPSPDPKFVTAVGHDAESGDAGEFAEAEAEADLPAPGRAEGFTDRSVSRREPQMPRSLSESDPEPRPAADRVPEPAAPDRPFVPPEPPRTSPADASYPSPSSRREWAPEAGDPMGAHWTVPEHEALELLPSSGHALLGLCIGIAVLLAVGCFYLGRTTGPNQAGAPTVATAISTMAPRATVDSAPTSSPDVGVGFVWGKVKTNDGSTLTVKSEINHSMVVVHTDDDTKVYVLVATTVAAIAEGAPVLIYGRKHADGSIDADTITGVSLRALGPR
ncbi:hypothetical protein [Nocardia sp. NBC_00416]|uniref:hypothetical protein n=1 Tax=Nocardia sp. NBC_00416 TaxID=2975991 RepID=UPI002E203FCF